MIRTVANAKRQLPTLKRAFKGLAEESRLTEIERWVYDRTRIAATLGAELAQDQDRDATALSTRSGADASGADTAVERGPRATAVRPIDDIAPGEGELVAGSIKRLASTYGFIKLDQGGDLFFHQSGCTKHTDFHKLAIGEKVRCRVGDDKGRRCGIQVELATES
jgi:cold shock CspA family protein